ncbi:MAG: GGDEF domain-containing protein [Bacteroidota bacterium]
MTAVTYVLGGLVLLGMLLALAVWRQSVARRFFQSLAHLGSALGEKRSPGDLGKRVLAAVCEDTGSEAGLLYLGEKNLAFRLKASHGLDQSQLSSAVIDAELHRRFLDRVSGGPAAISRVPLDEAGGFLAHYRWALVAPLAAGESIVGVLLLLRTEGRYKSQHLELLRRFAPQAAFSLANVSLNQENQDAAKENARLYLNLSRLYRQATVDNLTGLHNRLYMSQRLREEVKKAWRFRQPLALVLLDLDLFGKVNEEHGQKTGDEVLRDAARIVRRTARDYDVACRFGGEGIALILAQTDREGAFALAERIRREIGAHQFPAGVRLTCSVGVAAMAPAALPAVKRPDAAHLERAAEELVLLAEKAMECAKEAGRDRVEIAATLEPKAEVPSPQP